MSTKPIYLMLPLMLGLPGSAPWANTPHRPDLREVLKAQAASGGKPPTAQPAIEEKRLSPQERAELRQQLRRPSTVLPAKTTPQP